MSFFKMFNEHDIYEAFVSKVKDKREITSEEYWKIISEIAEQYPIHTKRYIDIVCWDNGWVTKFDDESKPYKINVENIMITDLRSIRINH